MSKVPKKPQACWNFVTVRIILSGLTSDICLQIFMNYRCTATIFFINILLYHPISSDPEFKNFWKICSIFKARMCWNPFKNVKPLKNSKKPNCSEAFTFLNGFQHLRALKMLQMLRTKNEFFQLSHSHWKSRKIEVGYALAVLVMWTCCAVRNGPTKRTGHPRATACFTLWAAPTV